MIIQESVTDHELATFRTFCVRTSWSTAESAMWKKLHESHRQAFH